MTEPWPNWEMHPKGDEIVHCISGRCAFITETADGTQSVELTAGQTVVVPRGTWHTARPDESADLLHITYGTGTTTRSAGETTG